MFAGQCRCLCFRNTFNITGFFPFPVFMNVCRSVTQPLLQAHIQHHRFLCISSVNKCLPVSVAAFASGTHSTSPVSLHLQCSRMFAGQCRCLCFRHTFSITVFLSISSVHECYQSANNTSCIVKYEV